jgi:ParB-like chromosome segregation protein Spo0J
MMGLIGINQDYVELMDAEDLKYPILVIDVEDVGNMVIDGWHRIAAAMRLGVTSLPAVFLHDDSGVRR